MKTLLMIIVWLVVWYLLWAYSVFKFTVDFSADNVSKIIVDSAQSVYSWSWTTVLWNTVNSAVNKKTQEIKSQIEQKQEELKENLKQQLIDYMKDRINSMF